MKVRKRKISAEKISAGLPISAEKNSAKNFAEIFSCRNFWRLMYYYKDSHKEICIVRHVQNFLYGLYQSWITGALFNLILANTELFWNLHRGNCWFCSKRCPKINTVRNFILNVFANYHWLIEGIHLTTYNQNIYSVPLFKMVISFTRSRSLLSSFTLLMTWGIKHRNISKRFYQNINKISNAKNFISKE